MAQKLEQLTKRGPQPGTGTFIRDHLKRVGEDYPYNVWKELRAYLASIGRKSPTLLSFQHYWHICHETELIRFSREEPGERLWPRRFYRLVPENMNSKDWRNPQAALDLRMGRTTPDPATGKMVPVSRLGRRRYRRRVLGVPPKRVGRPRKPKPIRGAVAVATDATRT